MRASNASSPSGSRRKPETSGPAAVVEAAAIFARPVSATSLRA